jgi:sodium/potassium-transporting ATPase subunit alpha
VARESLGFAKYHLPRSQYPESYQFEFKGPYNLDIPMDRLVFVGLVSLIDPPRESVPEAISKCKTAGIKVIMVTGDQQLTAAAIAKDIGIFEDETSVEVQERTGCTYEEAVEKAKAIVINGDMLTKAFQEDEGLPDNQKGKKLERWLLKPQIVFARTSPAQKLYIVKGCQKLGHTVAVTGDGVNDSPAINQADIGIAMGITGSDVAKDSADMVLLNDDFSAIILGIEEGRKIFDNLKKSIAYTLISNMPELLPFITFILVQIPLPISTVLILCIDLGADMIPAVAFSYEESELDIMTRRPRYKDEHLVTAKLLIYAYGQLGFINFTAGMMCYCVVMWDFGFNVYQCFYIILKAYYPHNTTDTFINDPALFFGNSNIETFKNDAGKWDLRLKDAETPGALVDSNNKVGARLVDWLYTVHMDQDLRMGYLQIDENTGVVSASQQFSPCRVYQISPISNRPVCYSTETLKYAQTAYYFAIVMGQFYVALCCKTRKVSITQQGLKNFFMIFGWFSEFAICIGLAYILPINKVFGSRDLILPHFYLPCIPACCLMLIWDECRKFLIRHWPTDNVKYPNWFERNVSY